MRRDGPNHHWTRNGGAGRYGRGVGARVHHFAAILLNGLRDYGIEPQVWGGESGCEHEWGQWCEKRDVREEAIHGKTRTTDRFYGDESRRFDGNHQKITAGQFCQKCSCWRGSLGLEPTPALYIEHMVAVFRAVRRVLRPDATMWLNLGDSYAASGMGGNPAESVHRKQATNAGSLIGGRRAPVGIKPKDLLGIPWMLAFALREDGWWLRSEITWAKRAPMPESVTDRPTSATEKVFLLTKSGNTTYWTHRDHAGSRIKPAPDYRWVDHDANDTETDVEPPHWRAGLLPDGRKRWSRINLWTAHDYFYDAEAVKEESEANEESQKRAEYGRYERTDTDAKRNTRTGKPDYLQREGNGYGGGKRNLRNFWLLGPEPFPEAHFATFVTEIPRRAILAGTSERGVCPQCGAPWERVVKRERVQQFGVTPKQQLYRDQRLASDKSTIGRTKAWGPDEGASETLGWWPTCGCDMHPAAPATVLDPFLGSGTTALVADRLGRDCVGIELSETYAEMARRRITEDAGMFAEVAAE